MKFLRLEVVASDRPDFFVIGLGDPSLRSTSAKIAW